METSTTTTARFVFELRFARAEFDWLACDVNGNVGFFSMAGAGPVPEAFNDIHALHDPADVAGWLRRFSACCDALAVEDHAGNTSEWFDIARRGVFAFDWDHKRRLCALIAKPQPVSRASAALHDRARIRLDVDFNTLRTFKRWP